MLSNFPGYSTFGGTCATNARKVASVLCEHFGMSKPKVDEVLKCFKIPEDIGKLNPYFLSMAIVFDMRIETYLTRSVEENELWDVHQIPTMSSIIRFLEDNGPTVTKLMDLTKGQIISQNLQAKSLLRYWRFLQKSKETENSETMLQSSFWDSAEEGIDQDSLQSYEHDYMTQDLLGGEGTQNEETREAIPRKRRIASGDEIEYGGADNEEEEEEWFHSGVDYHEVEDEEFEAIDQPDEDEA